MQEHDFSFNDLFIPLTTKKAIHWIVIIGLIIYFNSIFNGFIGDDYGQVVNITSILANTPKDIWYLPHYNNNGSFTVFAVIKRDRSSLFAHYSFIPNTLSWEMENRITSKRCCVKYIFSSSLWYCTRIY